MSQTGDDDDDPVSSAEYTAESTALSKGGGNKLAIRPKVFVRVMPRQGLPYNRWRQIHLRQALHVRGISGFSRSKDLDEMACALEELDQIYGRPSPYVGDFELAECAGEDVVHTSENAAVSADSGANDFVLRKATEEPSSLSPRTSRADGDDDEEVSLAGCAIESTVESAARSSASGNKSIGRRSVVVVRVMPKEGLPYKHWRQIHLRQALQVRGVSGFSKSKDLDEMACALEELDQIYGRPSPYVGDFELAADSKAYARISDSTITSSPPPLRIPDEVKLMALDAVRGGKVFKSSETIKTPFGCFRYGDVAAASTASKVDLFPTPVDKPTKHGSQEWKGKGKETACARELRDGHGRRSGAGMGSSSKHKNTRKTRHRRPRLVDVIASDTHGQHFVVSTVQPCRKALDAATTGINNSAWQDARQHFVDPDYPLGAGLPDDADWASAEPEVLAKHTIEATKLRSMWKEAIKNFNDVQSSVGSDAAAEGLLDLCEGNEAETKYVVVALERYLELLYKARTFELPQGNEREEVGGDEDSCGGDGDGDGDEENANVCVGNKRTRDLAKLWARTEREKTVSTERAAMQTEERKKAKGEKEELDVAGQTAASETASVLVRSLEKTVTKARHNLTGFQDGSSIGEEAKYRTDLARSEAEASATALRQRKREERDGIFSRYKHLRTEVDKEEGKEKPDTVALRFLEKELEECKNLLS